LSYPAYRKDDLLHVLDTIFDKAKPRIEDGALKFLADMCIVEPMCSPEEIKSHSIERHAMAGLGQMCFDVPIVIAVKICLQSQCQQPITTKPLLLEFCVVHQLAMAKMRAEWTKDTYRGLAFVAGITMEHIVFLEAGSLLEQARMCDISKLMKTAFFTDILTLSNHSFITSNIQDH
jgi:hypothetical protein